MKNTTQVSEVSAQHKSVSCPKCRGTEFTVGFTGKLVLDTAKDEIGIWDTDYLEEVGVCTSCDTKVNLEGN